MYRKSQAGSPFLFLPQQLPKISPGETKVMDRAGEMAQLVKDLYLVPRSHGGVCL